MNKREITLHVLTQTLGMPVTHLKKVLDAWEVDLGQAVNWEEEIPPERRPEIEAMLHREAEGILVKYQRLLQNHPELLEDRHQEIQKENAKKIRKARKS